MNILFARKKGSSIFQFLHIIIRITICIYILVAMCSRIIFLLLLCHNTFSSQLFGLKKYADIPIWLIVCCGSDDNAFAPFKKGTVNEFGAEIILLCCVCVCVDENRVWLKISWQKGNGKKENGG